MAKGKVKVRRWPKNKAEHRENQMRLWGGPEKLAQYETRELQTSDGRTLTYHVKVDPSGRMRILDTGEDAPNKYYSQSSRYYVLKRNARITRDSPDSRQRAWCVNYAEMKFPGGFLDSLGNLGLIRKIDGRRAEMNFGRTAKGRKFIDRAAAINSDWNSAVDEASRKGAQYILTIEQVNVKPEWWEAYCPLTSGGDHS